MSSEARVLLPRIGRVKKELPVGIGAIMSGEHSNEEEGSDIVGDDTPDGTSCWKSTAFMTGDGCGDTSGVECVEIR